MGRPRKFFSRKLFVYFTYFLRGGADGGGGGGGDFSSIFSSGVKKIEKLLINCIFNIKSNKKVNSVFFSDLIVENPRKSLFARILENPLFAKVSSREIS